MLMYAPMSRFNFQRLQLCASETEGVKSWLNGFLGKGVGCVCLCVWEASGVIQTEDDEEKSTNKVKNPPILRWKWTSSQLGLWRSGRRTLLSCHSVKWAMTAALITLSAPQTSWKMTAHHYQWDGNILLWSRWTSVGFCHFYKMDFVLVERGT